MAEYINREALIQYMEDCKDENAFTLMATGYAYAFIEDVPAADVVEVVRCKDCKHRKTENCSMYVECDCGSQHTWECDNDFCSYGERRSDNG